jgi:hypothetical protein
VLCSPVSLPLVLPESKEKRYTKIVLLLMPSAGVYRQPGVQLSRAEVLLRLAPRQLQPVQWMQLLQPQGLRLPVIRLSRVNLFFLRRYY